MDSVENPPFPTAAIAAIISVAVALTLLIAGLVFCHQRRRRRAATRTAATPDPESIVQEKLQSQASLPEADWPSSSSRPPGPHPTHSPTLRSTASAAAPSSPRSPATVGSATATPRGRKPSPLLPNLPNASVVSLGPSHVVPASVDSPHTSTHSGPVFDPYRYREVDGTPTALRGPGLSHTQRPALDPPRGPTLPVRKDSLSVPSAALTTTPSFGGSGGGRARSPEAKNASAACSSFFRPPRSSSLRKHSVAVPKYLRTVPPTPVVVEEEARSEATTTIPHKSSSSRTPRSVTHAPAATISLAVVTSPPAAASESPGTTAPPIVRNSPVVRASSPVVVETSASVSSSPAVKPATRVETASPVRTISPTSPWTHEETIPPALRTVVAAPPRDSVVERNMDSPILPAMLTQPVPPSHPLDTQGTITVSLGRAPASDLGAAPPPPPPAVPTATPESATSVLANYLRDVQSDERRRRHPDSYCTEDDSLLSLSLSDLSSLRDSGGGGVLPMKPEAVRPSLAERNRAFASSGSWPAPAETPPSRGDHGQAAAAQTRPPVVIVEGPDVAYTHTHTYTSTPQTPNFLAHIASLMNQQAREAISADNNNNSNSNNNNNNNNNNSPKQTLATLPYRPSPLATSMRPPNPRLSPHARPAAVDRQAHRRSSTVSGVRSSRQRDTHASERVSVPSDRSWSVSKYDYYRHGDVSPI